MKMRNIISICGMRDMGVKFLCSRSITQSGAPAHLIAYARRHEYAHLLYRYPLLSRINRNAHFQGMLRESVACGLIILHCY